MPSSGMSCRPRFTHVSNQAGPCFSSEAPIPTSICLPARCLQDTGGFHVETSKASRRLSNRWPTSCLQVLVHSIHRLEWARIQKRWISCLRFCCSFFSYFATIRLQNSSRLTPKGLATEAALGGRGQGPWLFACDSLVCLPTWVGPNRASRSGPSGGDASVKMTISS